MPPEHRTRNLYLPEVGTVEDISEHLHLTRETVRRRLRDGTLVGRKVGRRWYITRRALLGVLEGSGPQRPVPRPLLSILPGSGGEP